MTQEKYSFYLPANQINQFNYLMHLPTYYFLLALLINNGKFKKLIIWNFSSITFVCLL